MGLNWCFRSLAALIKYDRIIPISRRSGSGIVKGIYACDKDTFVLVKNALYGTGKTRGKFKTIECSIMDVADDIAYSTYDLEDVFKADFLTPLDILGSDAQLLEKVAAKVRKEIRSEFTHEDVLSVFMDIFEGLYAERGEENGSGVGRSGLFSAIESAIASRQLASNGYLRTQFTADLVSAFLSGVEVKVSNRRPNMSSVYLNSEIHRRVETLKHFTFESTIMSPKLRISERRGQEIVKQLFNEINSEDGWRLLPSDFQELYQSFEDEVDRKRVVCDFIAGMTDRYAVEFYGRIFSESPQSIFKPF